MTYYNNTVKQMKKKFIGCVIFSVILLIFMFAGTILMDTESFIAMMIVFFIGVLIVPIETLGVILNIKPILKGFFYPIPLVSYFIETTKACVIGIKAFVWLVRNWHNEE